jgi:hypothetical protein
MADKLTKEEREILDSYERGEWVTTYTSRQAA